MLGIGGTLHVHTDLKFEKIMQFSGWIFLLILLGFMGAWVLFEFVLDIIELSTSVSVFTLVIFMGINAAVSFGLATKINNNMDQKKE